MSPPAWLSHPLFNVASFLILGQVAKRMNLDEPTNLMYARAVYVMVQAIIMGLCYWLMSEVQKKNGQ
jgi:TRAP-type C4-dicarboxylate transport system permease small subunit